MLKASAPERADAEIWITEVARRIEKRKGHVVTEQDAARALAKIYTMAIAQGIARTQWFEAQDPVGEDQGFGLLARNGTPAASYTAFKTLTSHLGPTPKYLGWLALGTSGKGYGFVFQGKTAAGPGRLDAGLARRDKTIPFTTDVKVIDALSGMDVKLGVRPTIHLDRYARPCHRHARRTGEAGQGERQQEFPLGRRLLRGQDGPLRAWATPMAATASFRFSARRRRPSSSPTARPASSLAATSARR